MSFLRSISQWLVQTLEPYGAPGLMLIAIGDSSFLSLPEVNDAALMALSINNPLRMWELATMTVIGSIIGCCLLYAVGRRGGEALLNRRFAAEKVLKVRGWYQKYGMLAVIVPSLLPPPLPFKIFVLSAGAFEIPWIKFILAVAIGRSIRYFSEGLIAVWYGPRAMEIVEENFPIFGIVLATLIVVAALVFVFIRRRRLNARVTLLGLMAVLFVSGCVKTTPIPPRDLVPPSHPFSREQALERLEKMSREIQTVTGNVTLSGSTVRNDKILEPPFSIGGTLIMKRPKIFLKGSKVGVSLFEMVSDGSQYQIYANDELYVGGMEEGPPYKKFSHLKETQNQLIGIRPGKIQEALMIDVIPLLQNPSVAVKANTETIREPDRARRALVIEFVDVSSPKGARPLQTYYFDLGTDKVDLWRRKSYTKDGEEETDTRYSGYQDVPSISLRYPSKVEVRYFNNDTSVKIELDPKDMNFNGRDHETGEQRPDIDFNGYFSFEKHAGAKKTYKFEPQDAGPVTQQR
jgi:membrane protein YqaA with SNARE-associated domain